MIATSDGIVKMHLEAFLAWGEFERGLSLNTLSNYATDLRQFFRFLGDQHVRSPCDITPDHVRGFVRGLHEASQAASSIQRKLSALRTYFRFLVLNSSITSNPAAGIRGPKHRQRVRSVLTPDEIGRLLEAPGADDPLAVRDRALLEFMYSSGPRISEVTKLKITDLELEERLVIVRGKGSKDRKIPIGTKAAEAMEAYLKCGRPELLRACPEPKALFLNRSGRPLTTMGLRAILNRHVRKAGIEKHVTPHTLRHTCATHIIDRGGSILMIKELLGHEHIGTTQIYTQVSKAHLREQHKTYHPRG